MKMLRHRKSSVGAGHRDDDAAAQKVLKVCHPSPSPPPPPVIINLGISDKHNPAKGTS